MEIAPVLTELGTTVAVLLIFGWLIWKLVTPFIDRLMDNLDRQAASYELHAAGQAKTALALDTLCRRLDEIGEEHEDRAELQNGRQAELREAQGEIVAALRGLQQQFQAHEGRAAMRHEQQMEQGRDQVEQGQQIVRALKALNGRS